MNILSSILKYKCPACREGALFIEPFNYKSPLDMPEKCTVCGQRTSPELGFYYGSMFISYIGTGFIYLIIISICVWGFDLSINQSFVVLILFAALTYFKTARLARSVWIHLMVKYKK